MARIAEIQIAIAREQQRNQATEALRKLVRQERRNTACTDIERQQTMARIGDDEATIGVEREATGPAVILDDQFPLARVADAEHAAERRIDKQ